MEVRFWVSWVSFVRKASFERRNGWKIKGSKSIGKKNVQSKRRKFQTTSKKFDARLVTNNKLDFGLNGIW